MKIALSTPNLYNSKNANKQNVAFTGFADKSTNAIAKGILKVTDTKTFAKAVDFTKNHNFLDKNLYAHLIVFGSTLLSGFYVLKTLQNKQLDDQKRKTLAINQGLTWALSTFMAYSFDGWAKNKFDEKVIKKFVKANTIENMSDKAKKELKTLEKGFGVAKTMIIIDTVYRFIAPVMVTPIANRIGNKLNENKAAKKAALDKQA